MRNTAQAHRLEKDGVCELRFRHGIRADTVVPGEHSVKEPDGESRKLDCMAAVRRWEGREDAKADNVTVRSDFALNQWETMLSAKESHNIPVCLLHLNFKQRQRERSFHTGS